LVLRGCASYNDLPTRARFTPQALFTFTPATRQRHVIAPKFDAQTALRQPGCFSLNALARNACTRRIKLLVTRYSVLVVSVLSAHVIANFFPVLRVENDRVSDLPRIVACA
jgi:hypothetical protein